MITRLLGIVMHTKIHCFNCSRMQCRIRFLPKVNARRMSGQKKATKEFEERRKVSLSEKIKEQSNFVIN